MSETDWFACIRSKSRAPAAAVAHRPDNGASVNTSARRGTGMGAKKKRQGCGGVTPARDQLTAFIMKRLHDTGDVPTLRECMTELGWQQTSSVRDCLRKCVADGHLRQSVVDAVMARRT